MVGIAYHSFLNCPKGNNTMKKQTLTKQYQQLLDAGVSKATKRAHDGDTRRFWAYAKGQGVTENYPVPIDLVLQYILDNLNPDKSGPKLKVATLKRYLASLSVKQQTFGHPSILANPKIKILLRRAKRALPNQQPQRKKPITAAILKQLLQTCDDSLHGIRDKAILLLGFSSGGRRRSEITQLQVEDIQKNKTGYLLTLKKSKTDQEQKGMTVPLNGLAATALSQWLNKTKIKSGNLFRGIKTNNTLNDLPIDGSTINRMVKRRIKQANLNPTDYSAHSLRSGFMTTAINKGVPLLQAMKMTGHKSIDVAQQYYRETEIENNLASNLLSENKKLIK